jgi:N-terminal domain of toast_rack, DUF2154
MNRRRALLLAGVVGLTGALCLTACGIERTGPSRHESQSIERDDSQVVHANIDMGAGTLRVAGGTAKLATADFNYNMASWKPEVRYSSVAGRGSLTVGQPGHGNSSRGNVVNDWDVSLNQDIPFEVEVHLGAGEAHLNLGTLTLRKVDVEMGAGELDLDLRGTPKTSYEVRVQGGVGEATIRLPSSVGVEAKAMGGIGEVEASGLHHDGGRYFNDALATSPVTIHLDVQGGVGSIKLISY